MPNSLFSLINESVPSLPQAIHDGEKKTNNLRSGFGEEIGEELWDGGDQIQPQSKRGSKPCLPGLSAEKKTMQIRFCLLITNWTRSVDVHATGTKLMPDREDSNTAPPS